MQHSDSFFTPFTSDVSNLELPSEFTFPFFYAPHPISRVAAAELQTHLESVQDNWEHNFGFQNKQAAIGKMFGVLVVRNKEGKLGYLSAFSGKLGDSYKYDGFVPPLFDMLDPDSFFSIGIQEVNKIGEEILSIEKDELYLSLKAELQSEINKSKVRIKEQQDIMSFERKARKENKKKYIDILSPTDYENLLNRQKHESLSHQAYMKDVKKYWEVRIERTARKVSPYTERISELKQTRKEMSNDMQQQLFDQYHFLNINGNTKSVQDIFKDTAVRIPPAGAGECAAPKLLQYAFQHEYTPICMAEFWWGASPRSEIRKHKQFYPSCRGKCEPILGHMLTGMTIEESPLLQYDTSSIKIDIIYEDDALAIINKPSEFLSVPGKNFEDSIQTRMKKMYREATGPLIVHRLDLSTSGIMIIAKTKDAHQNLQYQFIKRIVKKRYVALLDGVLEKDKGVIDLPLRVDLDNRPHQLVCYEHGKSARTEWKIIERKGGKTRIHFFPITGRTHQLRVHAAHPDGLNTAIIGDDLYGTIKDRLHLHAEWIEFIHPISKEKMEFYIPSEF